ncbi:50S ribosomal protein L14e [Candidatus Woesearchaeota archaeon]|nr:50S ribosomal protein L14e [Candidatus Woesearchaeota archaeon]
MSIFEVGRICVKLAGRDAGRKCVIVEELDNHYVLVDGDVRRKKVNIRHLEPLEEILDIKEKASTETVKAFFAKKSWTIWDKESKKVADKPKAIRKGQGKEATPTTAKAKETKSIPEKAVKKTSKKKEE